MKIIFVIIFGTLTSYMLVMLVSIVSYYWFHRARYFKSSNELSLWSLFDCRRFSFCKKVCSTTDYDDKTLRSHLRTYIMIWNVWTYFSLTLFFALYLSSAVLGTLRQDSSDSPYKTTLCPILLPIVYTVAWNALYAVLEYTLLRGLELHVARDGTSQFWKKLSLIAFYLVCFLNLILLFHPPSYRVNEDNMCKPVLSNTETNIQQARRFSWIAFVFVSWALFVEPLWSLKRAVTSMGKLDGAMGKEQKKVKRNINHTVYRTSITSIVSQIILITSMLLFSLESESLVYPCSYAISFAFLVCVINLSYNDFAKRCCPFYYYCMETSLIRSSSIYSQSTNDERDTRQSTAHHTNPVSMDTELSLHATLEAKSISSANEHRIERFSPPQAMPV